MMKGFLPQTQLQCSLFLSGFFYACCCIRSTFKFSTNGRICPTLFCLRLFTDHVVFPGMHVPYLSQRPVGGCSAWCWKQHHDRHPNSSVFVLLVCRSLSLWMRRSRWRQKAGWRRNRPRSPTGTW